MNDRQNLRVAILDLYEDEPNQGMRCIREILDEFARSSGISILRNEFEVRIQKQVPDLSYDIYISTGGPGSPLDSEDSEWENMYFEWVSQIEEHNRIARSQDKKNVLFICHSFQLACRYFKLAHVTKRKSTAFGVFPVHLYESGIEEPVFAGLQDPFYAVDSRDYQVVQPDTSRLLDMGADILAIEKERPHIPLERAIMAIRFNEHMIGTQFHPEADASGMSMYLKREDKMNMVIAEYGKEKWQSMVEQLNDPDKIKWTNTHVIPNFLDQAIHLKS
jgi:homoserine O-succinyltransferase